MLPALAHRSGTLCNGGPWRVGQPGPSPIPSAAAARTLTSWRAASAAAPAAAPLPPAPAAQAQEQEQQAPASSSGRGSDLAGSIGTHPIPSRWLSHSLQLQDMLPIEVDLFLEQLRRQVGSRRRSAWQGEGDGEEELEGVELGLDLSSDEGEEHLSSDEEEEREEEEGEEDAAADSARAGDLAAAAAPPPLPLVPSSRGRRQRCSRGLRHCRGRLLAGAAAAADAAAASDGMRLRAGARNTLLPAGLGGCRAGKLLSAEQEALLGELVQAAKLAAADASALGRRQQQQLEQQQEHTPIAAAADCSYPQQQQQQQQQRRQQQQQGMEQRQPGTGAGLLPAEAPRQQLLRQGATARQLLFDCNLRLVGYMRRRMTGGASLPASMHEELTLAGREALWRAAGRFQPSRHTRFSTYACAAIRNALYDVLTDQPVHVPHHARVYARQLLGAARSLQQLQQQQRQAGGQPLRQQHQQQQRQAGGQPLRQQQQHQQHQQHGPSPQQQLRPQQQQLGPQQQQQQQQCKAALRRQQVQQQEPRPLPRLEELAAAAQLGQQHALAGLAATRRQRVASFDCDVPSNAMGGQLFTCRPSFVPFGDMQEGPTEEYMEEEEAEAAAAREAVEYILSRLPPGPKGHKLHQVLRLRFSLHPNEAPLRAGQAGEVHFATVGRMMGLSRARVQQLYHKAVAEARQVAAAGLC